MENNNNECETPLTDAPASAPAAEQASTPAPAAANAVRKNGRNKRATGSKSTTGATAEIPSCGIVEDLSVASEKLSGKHVSGYEPREKKQQESRAEESEEPQESAVEETPAAETSEVQENSEKASEQSADESSDEIHAGPSFETAFVKTQTVDVSLSEENAPKSRPQGTDAFKKAEIPYGELKGQESVMPPTSLMEKIRKFFAKLFGSKKSEAKNQRRFKNGKGGKNFHNRGQKNFRGGKGGFDKNRRGNNNNRRGGKNFHNRRPSNGNRRPDGGGESK